MKIEITNTSDDPRAKIVNGGLRTYNRRFSKGTSQPLSAYALNDEQQTIGGLIAVTFGGWLHIDELWINEQARGQSIGTDLMVAAEQEAIRRGCANATLDTFSFQALGFYLKLGYEQFGVLEGYAGQFQRHYLQKQLQRN